jgi:SAM-dependent methyltransferase
MYDSYAPIYDAIGQGAFAEMLVAQVLAALPAPPRRALDLACGTGAAALALADAGTGVVGVDRSSRMLAIAAGHARDRGLPVRFIEADLRELPIAGEPTARAQQHPSDHSREPGQSVALPHSDASNQRPHPASCILHPASFDLITCCYDSLNYLTGDGELTQVLTSAARLLVPGGRLIFDLNSEAEYAGWDDYDQVVHDAGGLLVYNRLSYNHTRRLARGRIVWFSREGARWWRGEEQHIQRAWSDAEVLAALESAGLQLLARRTPQWQPALPTAPRIVYDTETQRRRDFSPQRRRDTEGF